MALQYQKQQKRDPAAWLQKVTGHAPSAATQELFNAQREGRYVGVAEYGESRGPGGRRLQTVSRTTDLFSDGDDDEDAAAARRRREAELGADADMDEMLYEDDVADDGNDAHADGDGVVQKHLAQEPAGYPVETHVSRCMLQRAHEIMWRATYSACFALRTTRR